jgi:hypothetical protein
MDHGMEIDCQHVAPSDDHFTGRMRFHQSWYRRHVLDLPPGPNPAARGQLYGNMLRAEDGNRGFNFLSAAIHRCAAARLAENKGAVEPFRLRNNLLSSQPMCFNLFAPLKLDLDLATAVIRSLPGVSNEIRVTDVKLEFPPPEEQHLGDRTAFDAWIEYSRGDRHGFIGIETKLTETFSPKEYAFAPRYSRWLTEPGWWWQSGAEQHFKNPQFNQMWRNHLLAFAMLNQPTKRYQEAFCAVIHHDQDTTCPMAIAAYRQHVAALAQPTLLQWPLNEVITRWRGALADRAHHDWMNAFRLRYLGPSASEPAWRLFGRDGNH